jgi:hypothetical protein
MSDTHLWNSTWGPDKAGINRDKVKRSNMSGLGVRHVWDNSLEPG